MQNQWIVIGWIDPVSRRPQSVIWLKNGNEIEISRAQEYAKKRIDKDSIVKIYAPDELYPLERMRQELMNIKERE